MKLENINNREWATDLTKGLITSIQYGHALGPNPYTYKGITMWKDPFDLALYSKLLYEAKPSTIIEIGSYKGASAMWFADTMYNYGIAPNVISVDIVPVELVYPGARFITGDANNLGLVLDKILKDQPRPFLAVEDSNHMPSTCLLALEYLHNYLQKDEYLIVEDSIILELGNEKDYEDYGPALAINNFLNNHPNFYEIDSNYCDYFGYNVTWNINGYLRRVI